MLSKVNDMHKTKAEKLEEALDKFPKGCVFTAEALFHEVSGRKYDLSLGDVRFFLRNCTRVSKVGAYGSKFYRCMHYVVN